MCIHIDTRQNTTKKVSIVFGIELVTFAFVLKDAPYVFLAQSRDEMINSFGRVLIYGIATMPHSGSITASTAGSLIIPLQFLLLINNIRSQLYPVLKPFLDKCYNAFCRVPIAFIAQVFCATMMISEDLDENEGTLPGGYIAGDLVLSKVDSIGPHIPYNPDIVDFDGGASNNRNWLTTTNPMATTSKSTSTLKHQTVRRGDKGVVIAKCPESNFPNDYEKRVLVEFSGGMIVGLLVMSEIEVDFAPLKSSSSSSSEAVLGGGKNDSPELKIFDMMSSTKPPASNSRGGGTAAHTTKNIPPSSSGLEMVAIEKKQVGGSFL
jgi:hypothetical protein